MTGRTIAIGDIHGCAAALAAVIDAVAPTADDTIVTLGDYVDRGLHSREVLDQLSDEYDLVIVDAPPVLVAGDASILSALVDGTVLVLRAGQTDRGAALAAVRQLKSVGAIMLGAVLNDPDAKVANYEGHYYYAYEYYGEEEATT